MTERPVYTIRLVPMAHVGEPIRAIRGLLKIALRTFGLRAVSVREEWPSPETGEPEPTDDGRAR